MRIWRRRRSRRRFRLTREGKAFLFVTIGVGLAAVNTANNLLYLVLGLLLSLLLVSGILSDLALWRLRIERSIPSRVFAGTRSLIEVIAFNDKRWLSSVSVETIDELEHAKTEPAHFVRVAPLANERATYGLLSPRRGRLQFGVLRVVTRFPFGLIEKGYTVFLPDEVIVFPKLISTVAPPPLDQMAGEIAPLHKTGRGSEFAGSVRFYREGDEARDIHWKRTAARGELVVREREQDAQVLVTLAIDNAFDPKADRNGARRERFEQEISEMASNCAVYLNRGVSVQIQAAGSMSEVVAGGLAPDPLWRFLALLRPIAEAQAVDPVDKERAA